MNKRWLIIAAVLALLVAVYFGVTNSRALVPATRLAVHFINVGEGDSILIVTDTGKAILVDGGSRSAGQAVCDYIRNQQIGHLDAVILTHPNADHVGGLTEVIDRFQVDRVFSAPIQHRSRHYRYFMEAVDQKSIKKEIAYAGKIFDLDSDVTIHFLAPPVKPLEDTDSDTDNNSVVVKVTCGEVSYLLMSDAQRAEEQVLLTNPDLLSAQILKISQHGNAGTTSDELLKAISPHWAVISVGEDNDCDYPNPETLRRLLEAGVRVLRTDLNGSIVLSTDGTHIQESIENNSY